MGLMNIIHVFLSVIITVQAFEISVAPPTFPIVETQSTDLVIATIGQRIAPAPTNSLNCIIGKTTLRSSGRQTTIVGGSPFVVGTIDDSRNVGDITIIFNVDSPFKLDATRVDRYELFPTCTDPNNATNTQTNTVSVIVHVFSNTKPSFTKPTATMIMNATVNAFARIGVFVYDAMPNVKNVPTSDVLSFSVSNIEPKVDYFTLNTASGILTNKVDLRTATQSPIVLTIDVTDGYNSADTSLVLTVTIVLNQRPDILGLPATISRDENTKKFSIVDLTVYDEGVLTSLKPVCTVQPTDENQVFDLEDRPISLKPRGSQDGGTFLDFEKTTRYTVSCTVSDGFLQSQNEVLTLNVNNVNEPPVFSENVVNCIMDESQAGVSACNLGFSISDPEGNSFRTRLYQDGVKSERFALTSNTNNNNFNPNFFTKDHRLTFKIDYDVDRDRMPERVTLLVNAVDIDGAISTATVSVFIRDVNDNTPTFGINNIAADFTYQTRTGLWGSIQATDDDAGTNGEIDYRLIQVVPPNAINFVTVLGNGDIQYIRQYPESLAGSSVHLSVEAKDRGTPARSSTGTVVITLEATTTTSTTTTTTTTTTTIPTTFIPTTTPEPGFFEKAENVAIFSILMILLLLAFLIGLYFLFRWCITGSCCGGGAGQNGICDNCCKPPPPRRVEPSPMVYEDFDMPPVTASDYKGDFWHTGDSYVHGRPY